MKQVLLATTALVAFAGLAAAQEVTVGVSGSAEMGIAGGDEFVGFSEEFPDGFENQRVQFWQDAEINFEADGTTDMGLTFGLRADLADLTDVDPTDDNGFSVFIGGDFGNLTLGDTDGALDWALTEAGNVGNPGSIADNETSHVGYLGSYLDNAYDNQILRYDFSFEGFGIAVSMELDDDDLPGVDDGFAIGGRYSFDVQGATIMLGAGYQTANIVNEGFGPNDALEGDIFDLIGQADAEVWGFSAAAEFEQGFSVGGVYSTWNLNSVPGAEGVMNVDMEHWGIAGAYEFGPFSAHLNYGLYDIIGAPELADLQGWGFAAAYDLGGGASVNLGYGISDINRRGDLPDGDGQNWSLGVVMSF